MSSWKTNTGRKRKSGPRSSLTSQPLANSRLSETPCLKAVRQRMNDKVIRYPPLASAHTWTGTHTQIHSHMHASHILATHHILLHAQSRCIVDLCTVLKNTRVKAVSLRRCSNSHSHSGLGRTGCSPASSPRVYFHSAGRTGSLCICPLPSLPVLSPPLPNSLNLVLTVRVRTLFDSVPVTPPLWNPREKTNSDTRPALSERLPAVDPIPPTLTLSWLQFTLENDRLLSLVDSSLALL